MTLAGGRQRSDSDSCEARSGEQARLLAARTTPDPWRGMLDEPKIVQPHLSSGVSTLQTPSPPSCSSVARAVQLCRFDSSTARSTAGLAVARHRLLRKAAPSARRYTHLA